MDTPMFDATWTEKAANFRDHLREGVVGTRVAEKIEELWPEDLKSQIALVYTYQQTLAMVFTLLGEIPRETNADLDGAICRIAMDIARPLGYTDVITQMIEQTTPQWRHKTLRYVKFFLGMVRSV